MIVRFQADANLNQVVLWAVRRREPAVDFQTATEAGLAGLRDPGVVALAARDGRVLVTHDRKTMPQHFAEFITTATSAGVLIIPQHLSVAAGDLQVHLSARLHDIHDLMRHNEAPAQRQRITPAVYEGTAFWRLRR